MLQNRVALGVGTLTDISMGNPIVEVLDPTTNQPVSEPSAPQIISQWPNYINSGTAQFGEAANYPLAWELPLSINQMPPTHVQMAAVFPDSTGIVDIYAYDAFSLYCDATSNSSSTYYAIYSVDVTSTGIAQVAAYDSFNGLVQPEHGPGQHADVGIEGCNQASLVFPNGYMVVAPPQPDAFGDIGVGLNNLLHAVPFVSQGTTISAATLHYYYGDIIEFKDSDGALHKAMIASFVTTGLNGPSASGYMQGVWMLQLAADPTGTFAF